MLIERLAPEHLAEEIKGDLYEMFLYPIRSVSITGRARQKIFMPAWIGFLARNIFLENDQLIKNRNMTGSYFKMAKRSLLANKGTTTINVLGLVIGIASALAIISIIRFELSFDTFHTDHKNIYQDGEGERH